MVKEYLRVVIKINYSLMKLFLFWNKVSAKSSTLKVKRLELHNITQQHAFQKPKHLPNNLNRSETSSKNFSVRNQQRKTTFPKPKCVLHAFSSHDCKMKTNSSRRHSKTSHLSGVPRPPSPVSHLIRPVNHSKS